MTSGNTRQPEQANAEQRGRELEAELARAQAERDAAVAKLDTRERRRQIGGMARRITVGVLVVLVAILIPVTATVAWTHRTVVNTNGYVDTVAPIASDPAVTAAVARIATNQLYAALDPQARIADALPPRATFLAGPIADGTKGFINDRARTALASDRFQQLWVAANRTAHTALMKVLRGDSKAVVETNGQVVISVVPLLNEILQRMQGTVAGITGRDVQLPTLSGNELPSAACAKISAALNRPLPDTCGQIPLFPADKLDQAQWAIRAFDRAMIALLIVTPLLFVAALLLTRRRRRTLLQIAVGTLLVMVILRRTMMWLQNTVIETGRPENKAARDAIVHQLLNGFFTVSVWVLAITLAVMALALVTGPYGWAVRGRGWVASAARATVRQVRNAAVGREAAGGWVRAHLDLMRVAGIVLALLLILILDVSFIWLIVIVALLAGYEFWLNRLGPKRPAATVG
jgi:hypothetical protein